MKLNLDDIMEESKETPAEEEKVEEAPEETEEEEEKFNIGDVVYLIGYSTPAMIVHNLTVQDEDPTWIECVWFNGNDEMFFSAISMMCLTHIKPGSDKTPM